MRNNKRQRQSKNTPPTPPAEAQATPEVAGEELLEPAGQQPAEGSAPAQPAALLADQPAEEGVPAQPAALLADQPAEGSAPAQPEGDLEIAADALTEELLQRYRPDSSAWEILEERARSLAQLQQESVETLGDEVVLFRLGDGSYSLPARFIREVQPLEQYTELPGTPDFVVGLVNLRGRLLTALDIRPLLDLPNRPPQANAFLIVLTFGGIEISLLADSVDQVRRSNIDLAPALSSVAGRGLPWVLGIDRDMNLVLDPNGLMSDPRIIVNDEVN